MTDAIKTPPPATAKDLRNFGFTFGAVAAVIALWLLWRGRTGSAQGFAVAAVVFFLVGAVVPALLRPLHGGIGRWAMDPVKRFKMWSIPSPA